MNLIMKTKATGEVRWRRRQRFHRLLVGVVRSFQRRRKVVVVSVSSLFASSLLEKGW